MEGLLRNLDPKLRDLGHLQRSFRTNICPWALRLGMNNWTQFDRSTVPLENRIKRWKLRAASLKVLMQYPPTPKGNTLEEMDCWNKFAFRSSEVKGTHWWWCLRMVIRRGKIFILLDSETPSIFTDTALDHSHLATAVKTCMKLNHTQRKCGNYANHLDKNRYYTVATWLYHHTCFSKKKLQRGLLYKQREAVRGKNPRLNHRTRTFFAIEERFSQSAGWEGGTNKTSKGKTCEPTRPP